MSKTLFYNANVILPSSIIHANVLVENNTIIQISKDKIVSSGIDNYINVDSNYLSPGFIDIHTHGAGGSDFMDKTAESIYNACTFHLKHGTTSILPTTIAGSTEELFEVITLFNNIVPTGDNLPEILGLHLEGPYFAHSQRGAQNPEFLRNPCEDEYLTAINLSKKIKRWSFAVELEGADRFLKTLKENNIIASVAHSDATCAEVMQAASLGVNSITHFYSGMQSVRRKNGYRVAGAVEAGYLIDDMYVEVIADGRHLPKELLMLIYKVKGADYICLVSDSMRAAGMTDGEYVLGNKDTGLKTIVEDNVAKLPDRSAFAGSVATADKLIHTMYNIACIPLSECVKMMSLTPARLMGIDSRKGSIEIGKEADLLVFDENIAIKTTMLRGELLKS